MRPIKERTGVTPDIFQNEILPASQPVVMRGLVNDWAIVKAGKTSALEVWNYLRPFDRGHLATTMLAPPAANGRFFYNQDLTGFNFQHGRAKLATVFDFLLDNLEEERPSSLAMQSVPARGHLPGVEWQMPMPLLNDIEPRLWIGNAGIVAAHYDPSENIACVVAGTRRFTLFPPDQIGNLYIGPLDITPAGAAISMVSFENPDFERHPRFADALEAAQTAELLPGDAIYIPYIWWHHVRSLKPFNMLVNYWWDPPMVSRHSPRDLLVHAMLTVRNMAPAHRAAWRALFDHYIFQADGAGVDHIPAERRGALGALTPELIAAMQKELMEALTRAR